jgi:hypothetical protein
MTVRRDKNVIAKEKAATMPRAAGTQAFTVTLRKNLVGSGLSWEARRFDVGRVARPTTARRSRCDQNFTTVTLEMAVRSGSNI